MTKTYLGDSVYITQDPSWPAQLIIFTQNGPLPENEIYLEPEVIEALLKYIEKIKNGRKNS